MAIEQSEVGVAPVDRSTALLAELQAVCQRILADEGRLPGEPGHVVPTLISTANGSAVANSLEALRRQCADSNQQVVALKRSTDGLRAVVSRDSADNAKLLIELGRVIETMTKTVNREQADQHAQIGDLVRSVEALRVGLAGFSANNRQQVSELRGSLQGVEQSTAALRSQTDIGLAALEARVETGLATLRAQTEASLGALPSQVETAVIAQVGPAAEALSGRVDTALGTMGRHVAAGHATNERLQSELKGSMNALGRQVEIALASLGNQFTAAFATMAGQIQDAFNSFGQQVSQEMVSQSGSVDSLIQDRERLEELAELLSVGLPKFSEEIQTSVQQTLLAVSRTFRLAEREHGNRMAELHRDFDATARRLETAMQPRRREPGVGHDGQSRREVPQGPPDQD